MRAFLAIELDNETRKLLQSIQKQFQDAGVKGNYSFPDNLHLTIKFLSEIHDTQYDRITAMMKVIALKYHPFVLTVDSLGKFNKGSRMILWAGIKYDQTLVELYRDVDANLGGIVPGLEDKNYSPHITLVREAVSPRLFSELVVPIEKINKPFTAGGLSLMESTRLNSRLTYIRRAFEPFKIE